MEQKSLLPRLREDVDPRVIALSERMNTSLPYAIGIVEAIRLWVSEYSRKRTIGGYPNWVIAESIHFEGNPDVLVQSLCEVGWVTRESDGVLKLLGWRWQRGDKRTRRRDRIRAAGGDPSPRLRLEIFTRDQYRCVYCSCGEDLTIDHIIPVSAGGKTERSNLQTLCRCCNSSKRDFLEVPR